VSGPEAQWIWAEASAENVWLRGSFSAAKTGRAVLYITADDTFAVFLNGTPLDQSQADDTDPRQWQHVHTVVATAALKPGRNVLAVQAHNAAGAAGVIARLEVDGHPVALTSGSWRATAMEGDFRDSAFDDSDWPSARVVGDLLAEPWASGGALSPGGLEGWPGYLAPVPKHLRHVRITPRVIDVHAGEGAISGVAFGSTPAGLRVRLAAPGSANPPSITLDFGREVNGRVVLAADDHAEVQVGLGESPGEAANRPWRGSYWVSVAAARHLERFDGYRVAVAPGRPSATFLTGFRYARLVFSARPGLAETVTFAGIDGDVVYYPVRYAGSFESSDDRLGQIWATAAYTAHLNMQDLIWDGIKRDRKAWMGDMHVSGEVINIAFGDVFLPETTMSVLREQAQAGRPAAALPAGHVNDIPAYSMAWLSGLADFHRHVGDARYLASQHAQLVSMLAFLRGEVDANQHFVNARGSWPFVDWSPRLDGDTPESRAVNQWLLVQAVGDAAFLLRELGDQAQADSAATWRQQLIAAAQPQLTHPATAHEAAIAITSGGTTAAQTAALYDGQLSPGTPGWTTVATPRFTFYKLDAMARAGHVPEAMALLRSYYGGMLDASATSFWEVYDLSLTGDDIPARLHPGFADGTRPPYFASLCHAWASGAATFLTRWVLGIRPSEGGFRTVTVAPELGGLTWARGQVPTPNGPLAVSVTPGKLALMVPSGITVHAGLAGDALTLDGARVDGKREGDGRTYVDISQPGQHNLATR
jgi:hypothetical protein